MAVSVNWSTKVISIPQSYLTLISAGKYELDVNQLRLDLRALEDDEEGIVFPITHNHNTSVDLSGTTYARIIEFINSYTVDFEDGTYQVTCINANHNLGDVKVVDNVSLIIGNSAGLVEASGAGASAADIADAVWDEAIATHTTTGSTGEALTNAGASGNPWSTPVSGNTDPGTFGQAVSTIKKITLANS